MPFAKLQTFPGTPGHILVPEARQMDTNFFFSQDPEAAFGTESATREARIGPDLDGVKPWRRQVFGAKMREKNGRTLSLFSGSRSGVWQRKCDQGRLVLDQN